MRKAKRRERKVPSIVCADLALAKGGQIMLVLDAVEEYWAAAAALSLSILKSPKHL